MIHHLLERGELVLAAVSGGPDSVALLRVLELLRDEYDLRIAVAHFNHGLRGEEADREEQFVSLFCRQKGLDYFTKKVDIKKLQKNAGKSLEEVAREERYRFLYHIADKQHAEKIATGHHRDDQTETFLINLLRGAGPGGLKGIAPIRDGRLIRPLLYVGRDEILAFLKKEQLSYMQDSSNSDVSFLRNRIRTQLIPELTRLYNPKLALRLARTAEIIRLEDNYFEDVVRKLLVSWGITAEDKRSFFIPLSEFLKQHEAIRARVVKSLLERMLMFKREIGSRHIDAVMDLCQKNDTTVRTLNLPSGVVVERQPSRLIIRQESQTNNPDDTYHQDRGFEIKVEIPGVIHLDGRNIKTEFVDKPSLREIQSHPETAFLDYESVEEPLVLRSFRPGDRIDFLGLGGRKKVKKYFIDKKVPRHLRSRIPLLADRRSVIWIPGERISQRVGVTEHAKKVLKVELF